MRWRDGIHLSNTAIWCDARRARDICFVSVAGAVGRSRHGQLIASAESLALMDRAEIQEGTRLAVPYAQPFSLGTQRLELFRSGHGLGAASLALRRDDQTLVYAGAINPHGSLLGGAIDHRRAEVLILRGSYGQRSYSFAAPKQAQTQLRDRCQQIVARSGIAILLVTSSVKALDLAQLLADMDRPLKLHRRYHDAAKRARNQGIALPSLPRYQPGNSEAQLVIWPLQARKALKSVKLPAGSELLLVSGQAARPDTLASLGVHDGIALSNQADHRALVDYVRDCGAKSLYLTHSADQGADLAADLPGIAVQALGPPTQLQLF